MCFPVTIRGGPFTSTEPIVKHNPSSLYSYIGWKGTRCKETTNVAKKNAIPTLIYLDIFKNYFANTQEENFYMITGSTEAKVTIQQPEGDTFTAQVGKDVNHAWNVAKASSTTLKAGDNVKNYANFWKSVKIRFYNPTNMQSKESYVNYITTNCNGSTYINPQEHIDIFADTALDSQNFWVQTA